MAMAARAVGRGNGVRMMRSPHDRTRRQTAILVCSTVNSRQQYQCLIRARAFIRRLRRHGLLTYSCIHARHAHHAHYLRHSEIGGLAHGPARIAAATRPPEAGSFRLRGITPKETDMPTAPQAAAASDADPALLHLVCGKIAAGKSTLAKRLSQAPRSVLISEDAWLACLYPNEIHVLADYVRCAGRLRTAMADHIQV